MDDELRKLLNQLHGMPDEPIRQELPKLWLISSPGGAQYLTPQGNGEADPGKARVFGSEEAAQEWIMRNGLCQPCEIRFMPADLCID